MKYHKGGIVRGPGSENVVPILVERIGQGANGVCMYSINGGAPEAIYSAERLRAIGALRLEELRHKMTGDKP